jgi:hypothetical protein
MVLAMIPVPTTSYNTQYAMGVMQNFPTAYTIYDVSTSLYGSLIHTSNGIYTIGNNAANGVSAVSLLSKLDVIVFNW